MNPLTNVKNLQKLNERELELGVAGSKTSWHNQYKDSAWVFVGGLPYDLTEGDVICAFSQYGEIVNINYVRDKATGKPKGFCFICYEDQRSTILTVDNFNGIKLLGRTLKVDHVTNYKPPKVDDDVDELTKALREKGCAPRVSSDEELNSVVTKKVKKEKKKKKKEKHKKVKQEKKRKRKHETSSTSDDSESPDEICDDVGNALVEKRTVKYRHYRIDEEEFVEHNDNTREESSRTLAKETNKQRHRDQPDHTVSRRLDDHVRNGKTKKENREEYSGRNTSRHRERVENYESSRDTRMYDDRPDKHRERSGREVGDGYMDVRDKKCTKGHTGSDEDNRRCYSGSHQRVERHRDERTRRDDSNDRQRQKRRH